LVILSNRADEYDDEDQDFGKRGAGGIKISRRPNKRESIEKAPGPRRTRAAAIMMTKTVTTQESSR
jgi:hypothetical protein